MVVSKNKICLITEFFYPDNDATPKILSELCSYLTSKHGWSIDVITTRNLCRTPNACLPADDCWNGINIHRMKVPQSNRYPAPIRLLVGAYFARNAFKELMRRDRYDLVVVGTNPPAAPGAALNYKYRTGIPYVYVIHDLHPDIAVAIGSLSADGLPTRFIRKHQQQWLEHAAMITVLGKSMQEHLLEAYCVNENRCVVVPNWEDPEYIRPHSHDTQFRKNHNLTGYLALYSGNMGISHSISDILDAAKLLKDIEDLTIIMVGTEKQIKSVGSTIDNLGINNVRVFQYVPREQYPDLLASANVCLLSQKEGIGRLAVPSRLYSYMAAGRPIIAVADADSDINRIISQYECGVIVKPGNPEQLAGSIRKMYSDQDECIIMGSNARLVQEKQFTIQQSGDIFSGVLESLVNRKSST